MLKRLLLMSCFAAFFAAVGLFAQGGIGPIGNLQGRVDANNALVVTAAAAGTTGASTAPIANLPGKVDSNNNLLVTIGGGTATFGDGTSSAPSISFASEPTLGFYRRASGRIDYTVSGGSPTIDLSSLGIEIGSGGAFVWSSTATSDAAPDLSLSRDAANTLALRNAANAQTLRIGPTPGYVSIASTSLITPAASVAAGGTVNTMGEHTRGRYQITIAPATGDCSTAFNAGALTADCTIATLPAGMQIQKAYADVTAGFTCSGTCTGTKVMQCGISGAGTEILAASFNVAATGQAGDADAEMGSGLTRAAAIQGGYLPSWSATTPVVCRFTSGTGNWGSGAATFVNAGSVKITLITELIK